MLHIVDKFSDVAVASLGKVDHSEAFFLISEEITFKYIPITVNSATSSAHVSAASEIIELLWSRVQPESLIIRATIRPVVCTEALSLALST